MYNSLLYYFSDFEDFSPLPTNIEFQFTSLLGSTACQTISILDDDIPEENEQFTIEIFQGNIFDQISEPSVIYVTIIDDDNNDTGKFFQHCAQIFLYLF